MRNLSNLMIGIIIVFLLGCSNPKNIKITAENKDKIMELVKDKKLTGEETGLLLGYQMRMAFSGIGGEKDSLNPVGKTIGDLIDEQRQWQKNEELRQAEQKRLAEEAQAQLVISSSWRLMFDVDKVLDQFGLPKSVGKTPEINNATRGEEIQAWLNAHPECQRWLILDDEDDMLPEQFSAFFQTDPRVGLTKKVAERIVRFLEKPVNN